MAQNEMDREEAIAYLERKGAIERPTKNKFSKEEEHEIEKVMLEGKIYGDPLIDVGF
jgi:hypothetical protein